MNAQNEDKLPFDPKCIFDIKNDAEFNKRALEIFNYQVENNAVYKTYCNHLNIDRLSIDHYSKIPFLPISSFKTHVVINKGLSTEKEFTSSGTGSSGFSSHHVHDLTLYESSFKKGFDIFYPNSKDYCFLALLPNYLEREGSSLIYMAQQLIANSSDKDSGFYLDDLEGLAEVLLKKQKQGKKFILLGVTYALLDLAKSFPQNLSDGIIMETGGMKGRRKEMLREEVHLILKNAFNIEKVHSEYGMTELLSQAYSKGDGKFVCPPWMKILVRETTDPFHIVKEGKAGGINCIDLANIDSCAFIETQDLGKKITENEFEILGRFDNSEIRGCNLMVF